MTCDGCKKDCFTCEYSRGGIIYAYRPSLNRNGLVDIRGVEVKQ